MKADTRFIGLTIAFLATLACFAVTAPAAAAPARPVPSYKIITYLPLWEKWRADDIDVTKLTHINLAFAGIHENTLVDSLKSDQLKILRKLQRRNPLLKILISVGGWGSEGFSDTALTAASRASFTASVLAFLRRHKMDGIDLDWEYPVSGSGGNGGGTKGRPEDKENFTLLLQVLRDGLDAASRQDRKQYLLSFAGAINLSYLGSVELDKLAQLADYINLMTYDFHGGWDKATGFHTNLYPAAADPAALSADLAVKRYVKAGVPPDKIVVGTAFYGRGWSGVTAVDNGRLQPAGGTSKSYRYQDLARNYINRNGFTRYWDDQAKAPYLWNGDTFITYEDEESLAYRAIYIRANQLGGMMIWQYCQDLNGALLNKIYRELSY